MNHKFSLYVETNNIMPTELYVDVFHQRFDGILTIVQQGREDALLVIVDGPDVADKVAKWIEEPMTGYADNLPLFIVFKNAVHEYSPFKNGVRQLVHTY